MAITALVLAMLTALAGVPPGPVQTTPTPPVDAAGAARPGIKPIPDVEVRDQDGRKLRFVSDLLKNRTVVVSFFYTRCKGICPITGRALARLQAALSAAGRNDVYILSLSKDPEVDTPRRLKAWGKRLGVKPGWLLLTGEKQKMDELLLTLSGDPAQRGEHSDALLILDLDRGVWIRDAAFLDPEHYLQIVDDIGRRTRVMGRL
ncbi:MAG TPA: SCO family protein [Thermoanaerobaculia bacterium]|jgi:cytochrome oxidase Cu insertion factor (SCO1/SenC/PrrC family)|nr:SCO family protein [Thermoanaerobaculia bacterium]